MRALGFLMLTVLAALTARADFSYSTVSKTPAGERIIKHYFKGQKIIEDSGASVTVRDLDSQTQTTIDKTTKTYSVKPFSEIVSKSTVAGLSVQTDARKTGQRKNINGFDTEETVVTMAVESGQSKQPGAKVQSQMEFDVWMASDVPGIEEMLAFYRKNADRMPWVAMAAGNPGIAEVQRMMATAHGIPLLTTVRMKTAGANEQIAQGRARLEEMKKQGGPQAAMAEKLLAQLGGSEPIATNESTGFSASPVPDSVFAIPAGYQKVDK
jgi:hypothetical protein